MLNNKKKEEEMKMEYEAQVTRAHMFDWGCSFDMKVNGIAINNCTYREGVKDGKGWSMVSFPSYKGKDGKWYNYCWFKVSDALKENIEKQIADMLE